MGNHYTYRVEWSTDTEQYMARCVEITGLLASAPTAQQALARIEAAVVEHLREMDEVFGGEPPTPLTEQNYSGRFMVRTSRALHARLMVEAAEQGVSLNQWVAQKLADRKPNLDW
ncbi:MAG: type II toxin-antitoxin system HicB family antitoxin [Mycobacterium sp.]